MKIYAIQKVMRFSKHNEYSDPLAYFVSKEDAKDYADKMGFDTETFMRSDYVIRERWVFE